MTASIDESPCTVTANTEGSSGLYSTPVDMARWLKYLLGTGYPVQPREAQDVYLMPNQLVRIDGLNYAGDPSGIGLGWVHVLPANDPSHLVEKTGGGAGFLTYIAIHPASHTALFVAVTENRRPSATHFNLFRASNTVLLDLVGAPRLPEPAGAGKAHAKTRRGANASKSANASKGANARKGANAKRNAPAASARTRNKSARVPGKTAKKTAPKQRAPLTAKPTKKGHAAAKPPAKAHSRNRARR
jgi:D-alanyl-D-alanine-carboxypeptidase/D-alanyl-D-alanine-endopeptidase